MAAGDITRDPSSPRSTGDAWELTGTIEVDDTYRAFALTDTGHYLLSCQLNDQDGAGSVEADLNVNAAAIDTQGSISVAGNHITVNTYRYVCRFL